MTEDVVTEGRNAWERIRQSERLSWDDWIKVGRALLIGRSECMKLAGVNKPKGGKYNYVANQWIVANGFADICAQERHRVVRIIEHLTDVERWRDGLSPDRRRAVNHPSAWHTFQRETNPERPRYVTRAGGRPAKHYGSPIKPTQDMIREIAEVLRQNWNVGDYFVVAARIWDAVMTDKAELLELLTAAAPTPRAKSRAAQPQHASA
jgi:hypothetical protein